MKAAAFGGAVLCFVKGSVWVVAAAMSDGAVVPFAAGMAGLNVVIGGFLLWRSKKLPCRP